MLINLAIALLVMGVAVMLANLALPRPPV